MVLNLKNWPIPFKDLLLHPKNLANEWNFDHFERLNKLYSLTRHEISPEMIAKISNVEIANRMYKQIFTDMLISWKTAKWSASLMQFELVIKRLKMFQSIVFFVKCSVSLTEM